jgi:hypothetical protein
MLRLLTSSPNHLVTCALCKVMLRTSLSPAHPPYSHFHSLRPLEAFRSILHANEVLLYAISRFCRSELTAAEAAIAYAFDAIAAACAELVGISQPDPMNVFPPMREDAKLAGRTFSRHTLSAVYHEALTASAQLEIPDVYLSFLTEASTRARLSITKLLGAALRMPNYRTAVAEGILLAVRGPHRRNARRL